MTLNKIIDWIIYLAVFSVPLFFLPNLLEPLEAGKQAWFFFLILITLIVLASSFFKKDRLVFKKNLISWLLVLFLGLMAVSAALSGSHLMSWVGFSKQEYTSFSSLLFFAIFFWLVGSRARGKNFFAKAITTASFGAIIVGLIGIFSLIGVFLPFSFAENQAFNTVGTINSLGIYLAIITVLANSFFLFWQDKKKTVPVTVIILSLTTFVFLALNNYRLIWMILLVGLLTLLAMVFLRAHELHHTKKYLISAFMVIGAIILMFVSPNFISTPSEVSPNSATSWNIAKQALVGNFWFGTGPGTYVFDYARFKPTEVNQTNFWDIRFDRASSELLTMLPTKGFLPTTTLIIFSTALLFILVKNLFQKKENQWLAFVLIPAWLSLLFAFTVYSANFTLVFTFFFLAGLIYSLTQGHEVKINLTKTPRTKLISYLAPVLLILISVTCAFLISQRLVANHTFTKAVRLDREGGNVQEITQLIDRAASLNRYNDSYYRNLAAILLIEVENEINNIGSNQPTEEQNKYLQALVAASINAAKHANELEPRNVSNWLELGSIYRSFVPILDKTGDFSIAAFESAIDLEPANPANYVELGKTYLAITAASSENTNPELFDLADENFQKAIELKSDYAPAHYQLALSYEQQGRLNDAITKMVSIVQHNPQDIGAGFELGVLYLRRLEAGDLEAAENILKQVVEILPAYSNAHWYLGFVFEKKGDYASAVAEIEKVLELNPENEIIQTRLDYLKAGPPPEPVEEPATPEPVEDTAS